MASHAGTIPTLGGSDVGIRGGEKKAVTAVGGPYKGLRSYDTEDAHLFRGRDAATERIIAKILSSRLTVLHAPSAAGKTSLLNARIIPGLEARGWMAVRVRPENDPSAELRAEAFRQLLPRPRAEAMAIERAVNAFGARNDGMTIGELLVSFHALEPSDDRRRSLLMPIDSGDPLVTMTRGARVRPVFCRLLGGSIDVTRFDEHLSVICGDSLRSAAELPAAALVDELSSQRSQHVFDDLQKRVVTSADDLSSFFSNWWQVIASRYSEYSVVLILDQFEELFTRFADPGPGRQRPKEGTRDWRIRDRFLDELGDLYHLARGARASTETTAGARPSLRFVISLRDEYLAQIDRVYAVTERIDGASFHLPLLSVDEAGEAIGEPAGEFGYEYEAKCLDDILLKLGREGRFVEPAHLQIVCDRLWRECTQPPRDATTAQLADRRPPGTLDVATYEYLGCAEGILRRFFAEFLEELSPDERLEALEMLDLLVTPSGTRNIVPDGQLTNRRLRHKAMRVELLKKLDSAIIIRTEWRLGGRFVELTHEFVIEPLLQATAEYLSGTSDTARFAAARRALESASDPRGRNDDRLLLSGTEIDAVLTSEQRVAWDLASSTVLLRSAVFAGDATDPRSPDRLRECARLYERELAASMPESEDDRPARSRSADQPPKASTSEHSTALVLECITTLDEKHRDRAVHALAWMASERSINRLVELAVGGEMSLREPAEEELSHLDDESRKVAARRLASMLVDPLAASRAYMLLGRLTSTGDPVALPELLYRVRWRLARQALGKRMLPWHRRWRDPETWVRLRHGMSGAAVGAALVLLVVVLAFRGEASSAVVAFLPLLTISLLIAVPVIVLVATRRSDPIHLHADRSMASVVEVSRAFFGTLLSPTLLIVAAIATVASSRFAWPSTLAMMLIIAITAGSVRLGTLVAYQAHADTPQRTRSLQNAVGATIGVSVAGFGLFLLDDVAEQLRGQLLETWLLLIPACFGLARAYAQRELASAQGGKAVGLLRRSIVVIPFLTMGVLLLLAGRAPEFRSPRFALHSVPRADSGAVAGDTITISSNSSAVDTVRPGSRIVIRVKPSARADTGSFLLRAEAIADTSSSMKGLHIVRVGFDGDSSQGWSDFRPAHFDSFYGLVITVHDDPTTGDFASELLIRLDSGFTLRPPGKKQTLVALRISSGQGNSFVDPSSMQRSVRTLADSSMLSAYAGDTIAAKEEFERAFSSAQREGLHSLPASTLNALCWSGALVGQASQVIDSCNRAVELSEPYDIADSRGLARALTGDGPGAVADFRRYVAGSTANEPTSGTAKRQLRERWIEELSAGRQLQLTQVRRQLADLKRAP